MPGRITIFSLSTCPHCNRVKGLFKDKKWEYYDISLSDYPDKRVDMLQLTDRFVSYTRFSLCDTLGPTFATRDAEE